MEKTLSTLLPRVIGLTKKEIALQLDKNNPLFDFSRESGKSSYRNYSRNQLLEICIQFNIDPESDCHKTRRGLK